MTAGKIEKVRILAYNNPYYGDNHQVGGPLVAMVNPESYVLDYKIEFNESQAPGTSGTLQRFTAKRPEEIAFEFLFDSTGIIDGKPRSDVHDEIEAMKLILLGYDSESHEPKHFKLIWGKLIFKGRCNALTVTYKLFNPDRRTHPRHHGTFRQRSHHQATKRSHRHQCSRRLSYSGP